VVEGPGIGVVPSVEVTARTARDILQGAVVVHRPAQPDRKSFTVRRIIGAGGLRVDEYMLTHNGRTYYTVGIMEFVDGKVARETRYSGDPFAPAPSPAQWAGRMP
jgi:hypothetical protein